MKNREGTVWRVYDLAFHAALFFLLFELGAGSSFYLLEGSLAVLACGGIALFFLEFGGKPRRLLETLFRRLDGQLLPACLLLLYLLWDLVTAFYTPAPQMTWEKYRVVLLMLLFTPCLLLYCRGWRELEWVGTNVALVGLALSVMAVLNFLVLGIYPVPYALRLSLRTDYNMFAVTILLGLVAGAFQIIRREQTIMTKGALLGILLALELPVLYLSGSRRAYLLLLLVLPLLLVTFSALEGQRHSLPQVVLAAVSVMLSVGLVTAAITMGMQGYMRELDEAGGHPAGLESPGAGTSAGERYETAATGELFGKRSILWRIAFEEAATFTPLEMLVGKGNGYDILLYDHSADEALQTAYPDTQYRLGKLSAHNLFLADYLGGGAVKVLLLTALLLALAWNAILLLLCDFPRGLSYGVSLGIVVVGSLVSNRFGLLYDKFFYLYALLSILAVGWRRGGGAPGGPFGEGMR